MTKKTDNQESNENLPNPAVFITDGMQFSISGLSLTIGNDGKIEAGPVSLSTFFDICPHWLDIAYEHLLRTEQANRDLMSAIEAKNNDGIGNALRAEFSSGIQTMMASAVAIEAYYACIKDRIEIPEKLVRCWQKNGLARYKQIAETLRIAFPMKNESFKQVRDTLKEIYRFRDMAVHPPAKAAKPLLRQELNLIIDWRYVAFSYNNARHLSGFSLSIIAQTAARTTNVKFDTLKPYCEALMSKLSPLVERWNSQYGKLW
jgi:hypothetical protein